MQEVADGMDMDEEGGDGDGSGIHDQKMGQEGPGSAMGDKEGMTLTPHDIGAHWLQRELNKFYNDPLQVRILLVTLVLYLKKKT